MHIVNFLMTCSIFVQFCGFSKNISVYFWIYILKTKISKKNLSPSDKNSPPKDSLCYSKFGHILKFINIFSLDFSINVIVFINEHRHNWRCIIIFLVKVDVYEICLRKVFNINVNMCKLKLLFKIEHWYEKYSAKGHMNKEWFFFVQLWLLRVGHME